MGRVSEHDDDKGYGGSNSDDNDNDSGRDTGAGSSQSADQGRGGQADVGGANSSTGDSADNGSRDSDSGGFLSDAWDAAKSAMGLVDQYDHAGSLTEQAKTGSLHPRDYDIARGMVKGVEAQMASEGIKGFAPGGLAGVGIDAAVDATLGAGAPQSQHEDYGYASGRAQAKVGLLGKALGTGASIAGGPVAKSGVGMGISAYNSRGIMDLAEAANIDTSSSSEQVKESISDNSRQARSSFEDAKEAMASGKAGSYANIDWSQYAANHIPQRS